MSAELWTAVRIQKAAMHHQTEDEKRRDAATAERIYTQLASDDWMATAPGNPCIYPGCDQTGHPDADDLCGWHFKDRHRNHALFVAPPDED